MKGAAGGSRPFLCREDQIAAQSSKTHRAGGATRRLSQGFSFGTGGCRVGCVMAFSFFSNDMGAAGRWTYTVSRRWPGCDPACASRSRPASLQSLGNLSLNGATLTDRGPRRRSGIPERGVGSASWTRRAPQFSCRYGVRRRRSGIPSPPQRGFERARRRAHDPRDISETAFSTWQISSVSLRAVS